MVRLRWGFLDDALPVDWAEEGDTSLPSMLRMVNESGAVLEVVTGHAPSLADPWSRARRVRVSRKGLGRTVLRDARTGERISFAEIQAARLAPEGES